MNRPPDGTATTIDGEQPSRAGPSKPARYEMRQVAPLLAESFYIADGHHRYETAVNYRDWRAGQRAASTRTTRPASP